MSRIDRDCGFDGLFIFAGGGPQPFERRSCDGPYALNVEDNPNHGHEDNYAEPNHIPLTRQPIGYGGRTRCLLSLR